MQFVCIFEGIHILLHFDKFILCTLCDFELFWLEIKPIILSKACTFFQKARSDLFNLLVIDDLDVCLLNKHVK